jgi:hypothetical protein
MCDVPDGDGCDLWHEKARVARKAHECSACGSVIRPGDVYLVHFSLYEGDTNNEKCCFACWWAREQFEEAHECGIAPSALIDFLRECVVENDNRRDPWRAVLAPVLARYRTSDRLRRVRAKRRAKRPSSSPSESGVRG